GRLLQDIRGLPESIQSVAFSPDGNHLFVGGVLQEWDATTGRLIRSFAASNPWRIAVSQAGDQVLSEDSDSVKLWDVASGKMLYRFNEAGAQSIAFSRSKPQVLIAKQDAIKIFEKTGRQIRSIPVGSNKVSLVGAGYSLDERRIIAATDDNTIH